MEGAATNPGRPRLTAIGEEGGVPTLKGDPGTHSVCHSPTHSLTSLSLGPLTSWSHPSPASFLSCSPVGRAQRPH